MIHAHNLPSGMNNWLAMVGSTHAFMTLALTLNLNSKFAPCNGVWPLILISNLKFRPEFITVNAQKNLLIFGAGLDTFCMATFFRSAGRNCEKEKAPNVYVEGVTKHRLQKNVQKTYYLLVLNKRWVIRMDFSIFTIPQEIKQDVYDGTYTKSHEP